MKTGVAVLVVVGTIAGTLVAFGMFLQGRARHIIEAADSSSSDTVESISRKVGGFTGKSCRGELCSYNAAVTNKFIAGLHLAPFAELDATYYFDHGTRTLSLLDYRIAVRHGDSPVIHVQDDGQADQYWKGLFGVNPHGPHSAELWNGIVEFNTSTPLGQRRAARAINLRCLLPFNRCRDISDLLPAVWSRNSDGSVRCKFRTFGDAIGEWTHN